MRIFSSLFGCGKRKDDRYNNSGQGNRTKNGIMISHNFKILIIDDDIDFLKAFEYGLTQKKIDVLAVESGHGALKALGQEYFDLILLDLRMPVMSGLETFKKIREIEIEPFVIIMTAYSNEENVEEVKHMEPYAFLDKPFELGVLMPYIEQRIKEKTNGD